MSPNVPVCCALAALSLPAFASEKTLEKKPFSVEQTLGATLLPDTPVLLRLDMESIAAAEVKSVAAHGSRVKSGQILVEFDTESIDRKLDDQKRALDSAALSLAQAESEFHAMKDSQPLKLDAARRAARNAAEELDYFKSTDRKIREQRAEETLKRYQHALEGEQEELRQLEKMYKADDLTEETEEIILKRQRDSVLAAEFAMKVARLDHAQTLEKGIPHMAEELEATAKSTALTLSRVEADLPRQLSLKEIEVASARIALDRQKKDFETLKADRKQMNPWKAPADGWFYFGNIEEGRWSVGEITKGLVPTGQLPANRTFATFIPANSTHHLIAFVDEATAASLTTEAAGVANTAGREHLGFTVKVSNIAETPGTDGKYRVILDATWPENFAKIPGSSSQVRLFSYENPAAITVPVGALRAARDGWTVTVKMADGTTQPKPVKRGRVSGDQAEILSGLEPGQVIVTP